MFVKEIYLDENYSKYDFYTFFMTLFLLNLKDYVIIS